jgi:hypothetical protein
MSHDLLVVAELDDEVAVAVAEVVELAIFQEGLDHDATEWLDESHGIGPSRGGSSPVPSRQPAIGVRRRGGCKGRAGVEADPLSRALP